MDISQGKLAKLVDVHRNYAGKIERGEQNITINSHVRHIAARTPARFRDSLL